MNLIKNQQPDIDNIYLYVKDPFASKYQLLINGREKVGNKKLKNPKAWKLIKYSRWIVSKRKKLNISLVFIHNLISKMPKTIGLNIHIILSWKYLTKENFNK